MDGPGRPDFRASLGFFRYQAFPCNKDLVAFCSGLLDSSRSEHERLDHRIIFELENVFMTNAGLSATRTLN